MHPRVRSARPALSVWAVSDQRTDHVLLAACVLRWDDAVFITRAPGRLDVMGGIADYSGSLVLQMPIAEACHVALQKHPLDKQQLWKHIQVGGHRQKSGHQNACKQSLYTTAKRY